MDSLDLRVFDVGQGLSVALIENPAHYVTLVDLGSNTGFTPLKHLKRRNRPVLGRSHQDGLANLPAHYAR
jgi:hypothetical protein